MPKPLLRPSLIVDLPQSIGPTFRLLAQDLCALEDAGAEELLGFSLGHGVDDCYIGGAFSEYQWAFICTGDGRSCEGTVIRLAPRAREAIDDRMGLTDYGELARFLHDTLGLPTQEFETAHFAAFMIVISYNGGTAQPEPSEIRIFADPARNARDAERRAAGIEALFAFLGEWNMILNCYRYDLSTPDMLLHAA